MDLPGPRWKKGKDGKDFAALASVNPMSRIVAELQASLSDSKAVAILSGGGRDAILAVKPSQATLLNRTAFGRAVEYAGEERQWFQLGPEEVFFLFHALRCITVETENNKQMGEGELWDLLTSTSEPFPEMYKAYEHLRLKNWVVRSGLQYGADFVAYRHHPALVHSEFAVIIVPEGKAFGTRCGCVQVWSDLLCALRASGSVAKTLLVLTISTEKNCGSSDCLEQMIVHERTITRWIPQQCREQQDKPRREEPNRDVRRQKPCREEARREEQDKNRATKVVFETNCQELVRLWSMENVQRSSIAAILREIQSWCNSLVSFSLRYASRFCNLVAHELVEQVSSECVMGEWHQAPSNRYLESDCNHTHDQ